MSTCTAIATSEERRNVWAFHGEEWHLMLMSHPKEMAHEMAPKMTKAFSRIMREVVPVLVLSTEVAYPNAAL